MPPLKLVNIRVPKEDDDRIGDIARNRKKTKASVYREAITDYISTYSNIPSLKEVWRKLESVNVRLDNLERKV